MKHVILKDSEQLAEKKIKYNSFTITAEKSREAKVTPSKSFVERDLAVSYGLI